MAGITIVSVSYRSTSYLGPLLENLRQKAIDPAALRIHVVDNTNGNDLDIARLLAAVEGARLVPFDTGKARGSRAHALGLDFALRDVETEYAVIVDPDIHVFLHGWDRLCVAELERHGAFAIGAPYPAWKVGKYHDFPSPPFCFLRVRSFRELGAKFVPFGRHRLDDARALVTRQVGRLGNALTRRRYERSALLRRYASWAEHRLGVFGPDTGWRVAEAARARGLKSILFESALSTADDAALAAGSEGAPAALACLRHEFELYTYQGQPVMTHKYGSGAAPWRTARSNDVALWRDCIRRVENAQTTLGSS
ncbi:MAG TPA: hypothetical protein VNN72_30040 [Polyangiaceae bacterium]|nr:hypothetical protein [Polyangiaceae bacterium]